jgi:Pterin 4 alpha carbinolamine dehydratase
MQGDNKSDDSYHKLSEQEIQNELNRLQGWTIVNGKLNRRFEFNSFVDAFSFMTKVALAAEKMNQIQVFFVASALKFSYFFFLLFVIIITIQSKEYCELNIYFY